MSDNAIPNRVPPYEREATNFDTETYATRNRGARLTIEVQMYDGSVRVTEVTDLSQHFEATAQSLHAQATFLGTDENPVQAIRVSKLVEPYVEPEIEDDD